MQYFVLVPLFVTLYRWNAATGRKAAVYLVSACLLVCIITSWALAVKHEWSPITWDGKQNDRYREEGFSRPWVRCASYMIGVLFSFWWYNKKTYHPDYKFTGPQKKFMLGLSLFLLAITVYGPHSGSKDILPCTLIGSGPGCGSGWSQSDKAAVIALLRPVWTLGVGLLSLLCFNNQGGFIQSFLSWPGWAPLSTLSFSVYLVHYTVLTFYMGQRTLRISWRLFDFLSTFFGLFAISLGLGLAVVLLVEKPFMNLQKMFFEAKPKDAKPAKQLREGGQVEKISARNVN
jgi:peptidoglycan/LPS O-acetylase OafA/YrhL